MLKSPPGANVVIAIETCGHWRRCAACAAPTAVRVACGIIDSRSCGVLQQLRVLHARCLRSMCRVTRKHTWDHHISTEELMSRTGLDSADFYVAQRQLRWLGHVARMDFHRLPRRMLSAWTPHKRPRAAWSRGFECSPPRLRYGISPRTSNGTIFIAGVTKHGAWPDNQMNEKPLLRTRIPRDRRGGVC